MVQTEFLQCQRCGVQAPVRSLTPVFDRSESSAQGAVPAKRASVVIECPQCGVRIQLIELDVS
jgi:predicted RNA-binding Zn-ribbon protein involved in translation (DUF1610 family)